MTNIQFRRSMFGLLAMTGIALLFCFSFIELVASGARSMGTALAICVACMLPPCYCISHYMAMVSEREQIREVLTK